MTGLPPSNQTSTQSSRRVALERGLAAAAAGAAALTLGNLLRAGRAFGQDEAASAEDDPSVIEGAIGVEQQAVAAYEAKGRLLGSAVPVAELFARQHAEHVAALSKAQQDLGGDVPQAPLPSDIPGLTEVRAARQMIEFSIAIESQCLAYFVDAATKLDSGDLLRAGAQIAANDGQHLVVLRQALGIVPVPSAYPSGSERA